jgi:hypothetical protein
MKINNVTILTILTALFCTGFADCSFKAAQVTYKIVPCPTDSFAWPKLLKSNDGEMEVESMPFKDNKLECQKLRHYQVKTKFKKTFFIRQEWTTLDAYFGITKSTSCQLLIGIGLIGPQTSDSQMLERTQELLKGVPELLFRETPYAIEPQSQKIEVIGGKAEAIKWCEKLPLSI